MGFGGASKQQKQVVVKPFTTKCVLDSDELYENHRIKSKYRLKMVDWMIQVLRVLQTPTVETYFLSVALLDRYFKRKAELGKKLIKSNLHEIGLVSMYIASKV